MTDLRGESDPRSDDLELRTLLAGLARSRGWVVAGLFLGIAGGLMSALARPNVYVSEGKIEVRLGAREARAPETSLGTDGERPGPTPGIADELALLYNPELYQRIALEVGPRRLLAPYDPTAGDGPDTPTPLRWFHRLQVWWSRSQAPERTPEEELEEATALLMDTITVLALDNTSYLVVQSMASSPELAQSVTRAYVNCARQWHREVYSPSTELTFVSEQLERYEQQARAAEQAFAEHREACGFYDVEAQKKGLIATLSDLDDEIRQVEVRGVEARNELAFVERQLERTPETIQRRVPPTARVNPAHQATFEQLQGLEAERGRLAAEYTEGSEIFVRKAEQLDDSIERVRAQLEGLPEYVEVGQASIETIPNPRREDLLIRRDELQEQIETRATTLELWRAARAEQDQTLQKLLACESTHREMAGDEERAQARVVQLATALDRAKALALLDRQEDMDSLRIAQEGDLPREKAAPDRKRFLLLGLVGGLAAGLFAATIRFLLDDRLHEAAAVRRRLGLEVLAVVPELRRLPRPGGPAARPGESARVGATLEAALQALDRPLQSLWTSLLGSNPATGTRRVALVSPHREAGTTLLAACASVAVCRNLGTRVALVEANPIHPTLAGLFGTPAAPGFAELLSGRIPAAGALQTSAEPRLALFPGGSPGQEDPADWGGENVRQLFEEELPAFDLALVDVPPLLDHPVGRMVLGRCDVAVLILRAGRDRDEEAVAALQALRTAGVTVLGAVLNRTRSPWRML